MSIKIQGQIIGDTDVEQNKVIDQASAALGYDAEKITDTKEEFLLKKCAAYLTENSYSYEVSNEINTARDAVVKIDAVAIAVAEVTPIDPVIKVIP